MPRGPFAEGAFIIRRTTSPAAGKPPAWYVCSPDCGAVVFARLATVPR